MAAYETTRPAPFGAISIFHAVQGLSNAFARLRTWNDIRMTRNSLGKLTDRELDDIGLCRGDIDSFDFVGRS